MWRRLRRGRGCRRRESDQPVGRGHDRPPGGAAEEKEAARHAEELLAEVEAEKRAKGKKGKKKKGKGSGAGAAVPSQGLPEALAAGVD